MVLCVIGAVPFMGLLGLVLCSVTKGEAGRKCESSHPAASCLRSSRNEWLAFHFGYFPRIFLYLVNSLVSHSALGTGSADAQRTQ